MSGVFLKMRSVNLSGGFSGPASRGGVCKTGGAALPFHRLVPNSAGCLRSAGSRPPRTYQQNRPSRCRWQAARQPMMQRQGGTGFPSRQIASQPDETKRTIPCVSSMGVLSPTWPAWSRLSVMREGTSSCLWVLSPGGAMQHREGAARHGQWLPPRVWLCRPISSTRIG